MASRRHFKYIVRDQYGYVIQNAKVNFFQPGTSTVFTGSAFNQASGGSTVTNPFTTNAQGEVEAWFDTPQSLDIQVDDNTDLAYRAVNGSGSTVSFTTFTEQGEIHPLVAVDTTPSDPKTTASAGTGAGPARGDHVHGFAASTGLTTRTTKTTAAEAVLQTLTLPANTVSAGSMFAIRSHFYHTNGTTAVTFTFRIRWGGISGNLLGSAVSLVGTTTAHTDQPVTLEGLITIMAIGASGAGNATIEGFETITTTAATRTLYSSTQAANTTIDTTASKDLVLTAELSTVTGSPNLEIDNIVIEQVS